jgi:hypothetical protein
MPEWIQILEAASYTVTVFGLPYAIVLFIHERRQEREQETEEAFQRLSDDYLKFLELALPYADLGLFSQAPSNAQLNSEQMERKLILFDALVSTFERAYILVYQEKMDPQTQRLWNSWDDLIRSWCKRPDFRELLSGLLQGEDPQFCDYIRAVAVEYGEKSPDASP